MPLRHGQEDTDEMRIFISIRRDKKLGTKLLQPLNRDIGIVIGSDSYTKDALSY